MIVHSFIYPYSLDLTKQVLSPCSPGWIALVRSWIFIMHAYPCDHPNKINIISYSTVSVGKTFPTAFGGTKAHYPFLNPLGTPYPLQGTSTVSLIQWKKRVGHHGRNKVNNCHQTFHTYLASSLGWVTTLSAQVCWLNYIPIAFSAFRIGHNINCHLVEDRTDGRGWKKNKGSIMPVADPHIWYLLSLIFPHPVAVILMPVRSYLEFFLDLYPRGRHTGLRVSENSTSFSSSIMATSLAILSTLYFGWT